MQIVREAYKNQIVDGGKRLLHQGLTVGTWGNLSVRDPETGLVYIKPSGMPYDDIVADDVVVMDQNGRIVEGKRKPSIEFRLHLAIYAHRPDVLAVLHTHAIYSSVFGILHEEIPAISEDFAEIIGQRVSCSHYELPGTEALAESVIAALGDEKALLLPNHGAVCVGSSFEEALKVCAVLEKTAHIYLLARAIGKPEVLKPEDVDIMKNFMKTSYGQDK